MTRDDIIRMAKEAAAKHGHTFKDEPNDAVLEIIAEAYAMGAADEREQIADALRLRRLTLVKTDKGYDVMSLGRITAYGVRSQS